MRRLVFGHDAAIADWVAKKLDGVRFYGIACAIGVIDDQGTLIGGAVLANHSKFDVELTAYGPGAYTPSLLRALGKVIFDTLKCERCTVRVQRSNKPMVRVLPRLGFRQEGLARHLYGKGKRNDALLYGLLREDAGRFLRDTANAAEST